MLWLSHSGRVAAREPGGLRAQRGPLAGVQGSFVGAHLDGAACVRRPLRPCHLPGDRAVAFTKALCASRETRWGRSESTSAETKRPGNGHVATSTPAAPRTIRMVAKRSPRFIARTPCDVSQR